MRHVTNMVVQWSCSLHRGKGKRYSKEPKGTIWTFWTFCWKQRYESQRLGEGMKRRGRGGGGGEVGKGERRGGGGGEEGRRGRGRAE